MTYLLNVFAVKMKNNIRSFIAVTAVFLLTQTTTWAQIDPALLVNIHNVTDTEMSAILNPLPGSLIYNTTRNSIMQFNGTTWDKLLEDKVLNVEVLPKTANYTVALADNGKVITFDSTSDVTLTIASGLPIGFNISIYQIGDGRVTIAGAGGVSVKNRLSRFKTAGKDAGVGLICTATNSFHLTGDLKL